MPSIVLFHSKLASRFFMSIYICIYVRSKNKMEKFKSFAVQFALITGGCLVALYLYQEINKPRVLPPASSAPGS